ncbi:MAG TPA: hypothetical protein VJ765_05080 [Chitinophagaceae bacterium]|nr:hypothetical protein [Chitinophagaceae bacterium]
MKITSTFLSIVLFAFCANSKETNYTASTPAAAIVRKFLGISLNDSIDFIRWKLSLSDLRYTLECNYGIGKPNTNGFYNGGKKVAFNGTVKRDNKTNTYTLVNDMHTLKFVELNANLLHIANDDNVLLVGNGGWSYVLNNMTPLATDELKLIARQTKVKDSIAFQGRTPCGVPNIIPAGKECYKLKWYLVLYNNNSYRVLGTGYRLEGGRRGNWKMNTNKVGQIAYELNDETGKPFIHLLKLDDGVLIFTDEKGNLLVGDHDFSYTLNRKF